MARYTVLLLGNDIFRVRYTDGDTKEFLRLETLQNHIILYWKYHGP